MLIFGHCGFLSTAGTHLVDDSPTLHHTFCSHDHQVYLLQDVPEEHHTTFSQIACWGSWGFYLHIQSERTSQLGTPSSHNVAAMFCQRCKHCHYMATTQRTFCIELGIKHSGEISRKHFNQQNGGCKETHLFKVANL